MKLLIINADDLGLSKDINEAIRRCYEESVITGTSITPCGPSFEEGAEMLQDISRPEVGVHLTLTGSMKPRAKNRKKISTIIGPNGRFPAGYTDVAKGIFLKQIKLEQISEEFSAQIEAVGEKALKITHLDAHEHVHMFPGILGITIDLAVKYDIPYIRVPLERFDSVKKHFKTKDIVRYFGLKFFGASGMKTVSRLGVGHNDNFLGHFHSGRITDEVMGHFVDGLQDGLTELAVHPGIITKELLHVSPWHKNAEKELGVLLNGAWQEEARKREVQLVSHSEAMELSSCKL